MSKTTSNYGLFIAEGTDIFNPLTQTNSSYEKIDGQMKKNADNSVTNATETKTGTVHALVREVQSASVIRFMATSDYVSGDTFTVDGVVVSTVTTSGESIPDGAFIAGNSVIGVLVNNRLTLYVSVKPTSVEYAENAGNAVSATNAINANTAVNATNATTLDNNPSSYYATEQQFQNIDGRVSLLEKIDDLTSVVTFTNATSRVRCQAINLNSGERLCILNGVVIPTSTTITYTIPQSVYGVDIGAPLISLDSNPNRSISFGQKGTRDQLYTGTRTGLVANLPYTLNAIYLIA